jgi:hypothetical protein
MVTGSKLNKDIPKGWSDFSCWRNKVEDLWRRKKKLRVRKANTKDFRIHRFSDGSSKDCLHLTLTITE